MNIPELIKKIQDAQREYNRAVDNQYGKVLWKKYNNGYDILEEVIKELKQHIDDGK